MKVGTQGWHRAASWLGILTFCGLLWALPAEVRGESSRERIEALYLQSLEDYDNLRLEKGKQALRDALRLAASAGIEDTLIAQIHLHLGLILYAETKDAYLAEEEFLKAISIDGEVRLDPMNATPTLERAFSQAVERVPEAAASSGPSEATQSDGGANGIEHKPVTRAHAGVNIPLFLEVPQALPVYRVTVYFRNSPGGPYSQVNLEPSGVRGFSGYIPAEAVVGDYLEYYIAITDRRGAQLGTVGDRVEPMPVILTRGAVRAGDRLVPESLPDDGLAVGLALETGRSLRRRGHLQIGLGTGFGIAQGPPIRVPDVEIDPGLAWSPIHVLVELGFYPTERLLVLLAGRLQIIGEQERVLIEPMPSLRFRFFPFDYADRLFVGVGGGWCGFLDDCGYVQHNVDLSAALGYPYVDTTREGPGHAGLEGGIAFGSGNVEFVLSTFIYAMFPTVSFQTDINIGLAVSF